MGFVVKYNPDYKPGHKYYKKKYYHNPDAAEKIIQYVLRKDARANGIDNIRAEDKRQFQIQLDKIWRQYMDKK